MLRATRQCWGKGRVKLRREAEILHFALERYSTRPLSGRAQLREAEQRGFATFPVHHEPPQDMDRWWIVPDQHSLHDYPPGRPGSGETKCPLKTHHLLLPSCPPHVPQDVNPRGADCGPSSIHCCPWRSLGHGVSPRSPCHTPIPHSLDQPSDLDGDLLGSPPHTPEKNCSSSGYPGLE